MAEKITTETAAAVIPPPAAPAPASDTVKPERVETPAPETADEALGTAASEVADDAVSVDAAQMAERGRRQAAQFGRKATGRPGRPAARRAGGYVLTKDGWMLDRKATRPAEPGRPQVTFRGEGG